MRADLRTPPTTTISAILHTMSFASTDLSLSPAAFRKVFIVNLNNSSRGSGPEALPPNVLRGVPAGLTFDKSHLGI